MKLRIVAARRGEASGGYGNDRQCGALWVIRGVDMRARAEVGLMLRAEDGFAAGASVDYDGLGSEDYHAVVN